MRPSHLQLPILATLFATAAPTAAQTPCQLPSGPDGVVTDMPGIANFATDAGYDALSLGMGLTNVGTAPIAYSAGTNAHPVLGSALYRLRTVDGSTRFEQVGQSWVFHTFFALSGGGVCTCTPTGGTTLGVGCSDSSTANQQGSVAFLGPRTEIDGFSGAFPFPHGDPAIRGANVRRLRVAAVDIESTTGGAVRYFAEKHVVAPDDAAAGHAANNASYRELLTSNLGGEWNFAFTGGVQRERTALHAWQAADTDVAIATIEMPGEGTFLLGSKVTGLGSGKWHYEYALYNATSHAGARAFRIALSPGVHITSAGFHDVAYHGGDGPGGVDVDGADWTLEHAQPHLRWHTQSFAENPSANALRWRSLYNFRFDANSAPIPGAATITSFRGDTAVNARVLVPSAAPFLGGTFCFGDGSLATACPCALPNTVPSPSGAADAGCANSFEQSGARLRGFGSTSPDHVVLQATELPPTAFTQFFVGSGVDAAGFAVGDGVRCVAGTLVRFGSQNSLLGTATYPVAGRAPAVPLSIVGATPPGSGATARYQALYRNPVAGFCSSGTINLTNATAIVWN
ncbi:MAG: hypothetical protein ACKVWV_15245 [Planctomycetota bacterium]